MRVKGSRYLIAIGTILASLLATGAWRTLLLVTTFASPESTTGMILQEGEPDHDLAPNWGRGSFFIENVGQFDDEVRLLLRQSSRLTWLTGNSLWISALDEESLAAAQEHWQETGNRQLSIPGAHLKVQFVGANSQPVIEPFGQSSTRVSYFLGDDSAAWRAGVPVWGGVRYRDLYPGIDLVISSEGVAPAGPLPLPWYLEVDAEADLGVVQLQIDGPDSIEADNGELQMSTMAGQLLLSLLPVKGTGDDISGEGTLAAAEPSVTSRESQRFIVTAPFRDEESRQVSYAGAPADATDLAYSTYLGGSGNADFGEDVAVDDVGAAYVVGHTQSADFPTTPGAYTTTLQARDTFVSKFDPAGNGWVDLVYSTFIGGGSFDDGLGIDVANGQAHLVGVTSSRAFPTTSGAFQESCGADALCDGFDDAFLAILSADGSDLVYSTFLGGKDQDTANAIAITGGEVYAAGKTRSSDFPTTNGAFDRECGSDGKCDPSGNDPGLDGFFVKMVAAGNGQNDLLYGTFLGGWDDDEAEDIAATGGDALIIGDTDSPDFPISPGGAGYGGNGDAFVMRLSPDGTGSSDRLFGLFLGGAQLETGTGIDAIGNSAVVVGLTRSEFTFPTTAGAESYHGGFSDAYVVWLDGSGAVTYAAFLGGSLLETAEAVKLDGRGGAILAGYTFSSDFPTVDAYDDTHNGGYDVFVARADLNSTKRSDFLTYATFLGGSADDEGYGLDVDATGHAYLTGPTLSADFPTTAGAFSAVISGTRDIFLSKLRAVPAPAIDIEKSTNGLDADEPTGPYLPVGSQVNWQYVITNTGGFTLTDVQVNDDQLGFVCSRTALSPDDSFVCDKIGSAAPDQYFNAATVTADAPPELDLDPVTDIDLSHYFGAVPSIDIEKYTNDHNADAGPGPFIRVAEPVTWTFVVTNTGNVKLNGIVVTDSLEGPAACDYTELERNQTATCIITATNGSVAGPYTNTGYVVAIPSGGLAQVTDQDNSHYFGADPSVAMQKLTNGQIARDMPGPYILVTDPVTWTYVVTNTGNVPVTVLAIVDDQNVPVSCPSPEISVDGWTVCTGSELSIAGQYTNTAEVQAAPPVGDDVTAADISHYFGVDPAVSIKKLTNGEDANEAPGPLISEGDTVNWTYIVTNTGNITLTAMTVTDSEGVVVNCDPTPIVPGRTKTCTASESAVSSQYSNTGTVVATPLFGPDVTWSDVSHYYGSSPAITVVKRTNGVIARSEPGPAIKVGEAVNWSYEVSNSGNITLTGITVTDSKLGAITCAADTLGQGETVTCHASGVVTAGQYSNTVFVVGTPPVGEDVTSGDVSHYYGLDAGVSLKKLTNGQVVDKKPGPYVLVNDLVTWTFVVSNTGNSTLTEITLTDDQLGPVTCPQSELDSGQLMICEVIQLAKAGQYTNTATVEGKPPIGPNVTADDSSHYYGVDPGVAITKLTNGQDAESAPGSYIMVNDTVSWTYVVTNTGNITLTTVTVTDSQGETVSCNETSLGLDSAMTCTAFGTAESGQYSNTGLVTATPLFGPQVMATDLSHYFGVWPELKLTKRTNGQIARRSPGPYVLVNKPVTWTYEIINTGNITLSTITLVDDRLGEIHCPKDVLGLGESMTCVKIGVATAGQYTNTATVTGTPSADPGPVTASLRRPFTSRARAAMAHRLSTEFACSFDFLTVGDSLSCEYDEIGPAGLYTNPAAAYAGLAATLNATASDISHYFGAEPVIAIRKYTNGVHADKAPGPIVDFRAGESVTWTIVVSNAGNVPLEEVIVMDDNGSPQNPGDDIPCEFGEIAVDAPAESCTFSAPAVAGQYVNVASVSATPPGGLNPIVNQDISHYFGSEPSITLTKYTNGVDVESAPGPNIAIGRPVLWSYQVRNTGNITLTQLTVVDVEGILIDPASAVTVCEIEELGPGLVDSCSLQGSAVAGQYTNTAMVSGLPPLGDTVIGDDKSYYYGMTDTYIYIPLIVKE